MLTIESLVYILANFLFTQYTISYVYYNAENMKSCFMVCKVDREYLTEGITRRVIITAIFIKLYCSKKRERN